MNTKSTKSKRSKSRLGSIFARGDANDNKVADWNTASGDLVLDLIAKLGAMSGAVRFGYTRDGGAYSLGIYLDDDSETFYFPPGQDIDDNLRAMIERIDAANDGSDK